MSPQNSTECSSCRKKQSDLPNPLKCCGKCKCQWYCSRDCQKNDWKVHKKTCVQSNSTHESANVSSEQRLNPQAVCYISKPFTSLNNGTWLHNRPKKDVFKLLVDTYRMRMEDEYVFEGEVYEGSLYSGAGPDRAARHFRRFLNKAIKLDAKRDKKLLPDWWSEHSLRECVEFAGIDDFSNVGYAVEKHDIQDHYGQLDMPMQFRMFSEKIDGTLAAGMSGESMLQLRVAIEANAMNGMSVTHISL